MGSNMFDDDNLGSFNFESDLNDFDSTDDTHGETDKYDEMDNLDDFDAFNNLGKTEENTQSNENNKMAPYKKVLIFLGTATVLLALIGTLLIPKIRGIASNTDTKHTEITSTSSSESVEENKESKPESRITNENKVSTGTNWSAFKDANVAFEDEYVQCIFTVTDIKHLVKKANETSNIQLKSMLTGNISGYIGTYELEIPYSKGRLLSIGKSFNVEVQMGKYNEKVVIGEIKY